MKIWKKVVAYTFLGLVLLFTYLPMLLLIVFSFTDSKVLGSWDGWSIRLYENLFGNERIMTALLNTLIIAVASGLLATFLGTICAVGVYYFKKRPRAIVSTMNQITVVNAEIVTAVAFMLFFSVVAKILGSIFGSKVSLFGFGTLIIAHTMITTPYVILSVSPKLQQLNPNLFEAGKDLGASSAGVLFKVILPQLIPGMLSGFLMAFTLSLDDFVVTQYTRGTTIETISTLIYNETKHGIPQEFRALSALFFVVVMLVLIGINLYAKKKSAKKYNAANI